MPIEPRIGFEVRRDGSVPTVASWALPVVKIGRRASSHIRIDDERVEGTHALVELDDQGRATLTDLGTPSGTLLNGRRVFRAELAGGDEVVIGGTRLTVRIGAAWPIAPLPPPAVPSAAPLCAARTGLHDAGRAIEITVLLGDSVIDVRHLARSRRASRRGLTLALLSAGLLSLAVAGATLAHATLVARANARDLRRFTDVEGRPAADFRPRRLHPRHDLLAIGGLAVGLVLFAVVVARIASGRRINRFRIGTAADVDFPADVLPAGMDSLALVEPIADGFALSWTDGMIGEVELRGRSVPLAGLARPFPLVPGARARVAAGHATFLVASVPVPGRRIASRFQVDGPSLVAVIVSTAIHLVGLLACFFAPVPHGCIACGDDADYMPVCQLRVRVDTPLSVVTDLATRLGYRGFLRGLSNGVTRFLFGTRALPSEIDWARRDLDLTFSDLGDVIPAQLSAYLWDDIHVPLPASSGWGTRHPRPPRRSAPVVRFGTLVTAHGYQASIRRSLHDRIDRFEYCYDRELISEPGLSGTINVGFTVEADGRVSLVGAAGMGKRALEDCIEEVIHTIAFPGPETTLGVTLPITFLLAD